jgi:protein O-mannosyl-transferase
MNTYQKNFLFRHFCSFAVIILVGIFSYSNSLHSPFQFDGVIHIQKNEALRSMDGFYKKYDLTNYANRFVSVLTLVFNIYLGDTDTFGFHLLSLQIHLWVCLLIYIVARILLNSFPKNGKIKRKFNLPLLAAIFFSAHPVFTQTVSYLVNRSALLSSFFYLFSFYSFICALQAYFSEPKAPFRRLKYFSLFTFSVVLMALGIASKLTIISLPIIICIFYVLIQYRSKEGIVTFIRREKNLILALLTPLIVVLVQRAFFSHTGLFRLADAGSRTIDRLDYFLSQIKWLVFYYLKLLSFPFNQNIDPTISLIKSVYDPKLWIGILFLTFILYSLQKLQRAVIFGILWFLISLSPESSFMPLKDTVMEHRLYLPGIGLAIALSAIIVKRQVFIILICIIPIFSAITLNRNLDWSSEYNLWLDASKKSPEKARPHLNLGRALSLMNRYQESIPHYQKTIKLKPDFFEAYHNLGVSFSLTDQCQNAFSPLEKALELHPGQVETMLTMATCYKTLKDYKNTAKYLQRATEQAPNKDYIARELGSIYYFYLDEKEKGKLFFKKALKLNPYSPQNIALKAFFQK